jgi:hypothetical protein
MTSLINTLFVFEYYIVYGVRLCFIVAVNSPVYPTPLIGEAWT